MSSGHEAPVPPSPAEAAAAAGVPVVELPQIDDYEELRRATRAAYDAAAAMPEAQRAPIDLNKVAEAAGFVATVGGSVVAGGGRHARRRHTPGSPAPDGAAPAVEEESGLVKLARRLRVRSTPSPGGDPDKKKEKPTLGDPALDYGIDPDDPDFLLETQAAIKASGGGNEGRFGSQKLVINDPAPGWGKKKVKGHRPHVAIPHMEKKNEFDDKYVDFDYETFGGRNPEEASRRFANSWIDLIKKRTLPVAALALGTVMFKDAGAAEAFFANVGHWIDSGIDFAQGAYSTPVHHFSDIWNGHYYRGSAQPMEDLSKLPYGKFPRNIHMGEAADFVDRHHRAMALGTIGLLGYYGGRRTVLRPREFGGDIWHAVRDTAGIPLSLGREAIHITRNRVTHPAKHGAHSAKHAAHRVRHPLGDDAAH